ncbi:MAG: PD-(D/E)XK nuclease family protein, partial [Pseudomonadota bacterium]
VSGRMQVGAGEAAFTLTARADRIDVARDGVSIYDYKGGKAIDTRGRSAVALRDPQLPLEAAIVKAGGFANVEGPLKTLGYISTSGGEPPGATFLLSRVKEMKDLGDFEALADAALKDLENLVAAFASEATPYTAVRRPAFDYRFDAYEQLARVKEWSADPDAGEAAA